MNNMKIEIDLSIRKLMLAFIIIALLSSAIVNARLDIDTNSVDYTDGIDFVISSDGNISIQATYDLNITSDVNISDNCTANDFHGDGGNLTNLMMYAQLSDNTDQTFALVNTPYEVNFSTNDEIDGISHVAGAANITIIYDGVYQFIAQPQVMAGAGDAGVFHMWYQKNAVDIPNSNVELTLDSLDEDVIPLSVVLYLNSGDMIRIMVSVSDNGIELDAQAPAGEPAIPSIILSVIGNR